MELAVWECDSRLNSYQKPHQYISFSKTFTLSFSKLTSIHLQSYYYVILYINRIKIYIFTC